MAKEEEIGALWESETRNGGTYLKGKINGQPVVIFRNTHKQPGEKTPDYRVYPQRPMPEQVREAAKPNRTNPEPPRVADDDIPF